LVPALSGPAISAEADPTSLDKIVVLGVTGVNRLYALLMVPAIAFTRLHAELAKHIRRSSDES
jgi:hypothetical protein